MIPPSLITGPILTIGHAGQQQRITIEGVNVAIGDRVRWVPIGATTCNTNGLDARTYSTSTVGINGSVDVSVPDAGLYVMCYQWKYASYSFGPTTFQLLPQLKLMQVEIHTPTVFPYGTALNCASNITIFGKGFDLLNESNWGTNETLPINCSYGTNGALASEVPLERNDSYLLCQTPLFTTAGVIGLHLNFGGFKLLTALSSFTVADLSAINILSALPAGGVYNTELMVDVKGTGFMDLGDPRCKFGDFIGNPAKVLGAADFVKCPKPAFPDSERSSVGTYQMSFSPNGQCFATVQSVAANAQSVSTFTTYNALLETLLVTGGPSNVDVEIGLRGTGFPLIPGALCNFSRTGVDPIIKNATIISATYATCPSPKGLVNGVAYDLSLLLNGVTDTVTMGDVGGVLKYKEYDLSKVIITSIFPPGAETNEATTVTLTGTGFASYGSGQLLCELIESGGATTRAAAQLLGSTGTLLTCPFKTPSVPDPSIKIRLSLNNGTSGTYVANEPTFIVYPKIRVDYVTPAKGDANGGNEVTIFGSGFEGLSTLDWKRQLYMRCRFGAEVQKQAPSWHNDTAVKCISTWGKEDPAGQVVSVALNSVSFYSGTHARFIFEGLHVPAIVETYFPSDAKSLVIRFDNQATNRGGMNGRLPCSIVLSQATVATLKGTSPSDTLCEFIDDFTLMVYLDLYTSAAPGMTVTLNPNVVWPKAWAYPGTCAVPKSMCAGALSSIVSSNYPCDKRDTDEIEACVKPVALIQAPVKISSCPGTSVTLEGSRSTGGGIKPLTFQWASNPTKSDNFYEIRPSVCAPET